MKSLILALFLVFSGGAVFGNSNIEKGLESYVNNDFKKAFDFFSKSCNCGPALGCNMVGAMYARGAVV